MKMKVNVNVKHYNEKKVNEEKLKQLIKLGCSFDNALFLSSLDDTDIELLKNILLDGER